MRMRYYISSCVLLLLVAYGCRGSAEIEMKGAQQAMEKAKSRHAAELAPADFQQAQKAWDRAQAAERDGNTGTAKVLFESARIYYGKSADIARSKQDALSRQLDNMRLMISSNFDQVKRELIRGNLSPEQEAKVRAIVSEVEEGNDTITKFVISDDYLKAVATAKEVQTRIYNAQLILAGKNAR